MKLDLSKQLIASVFITRKGKDVSLQDFVMELSYKKQLLTEEQVNLFVDICRTSGLLVDKGDTLQPGFNFTGVEVPLVFSFKPEEVLSSEGSSLIDRMLMAVDASGKINVEDATEKAREIQDFMKYMTFEIALLSVMREEGIDVAPFLEELS
ncbi:MAG: DUF2240 family protein [Candidatus Thermoplasmatota archaeon]|nr:DUF2240 family protein [Candidatus Thermoplasmatota archaeon]MCL5438230.1 DUF2240 family protein [Candidatus Thermoplasmatota archaeon]